jgi:phosphatidylglycerophosphate synthase
MNESYTPDRRPLGARDWNLSNVASAWLVKIGASPNVISVTGLFASIGVCAAFVASSHCENPALWLVVGCLLILVRGMCNMLDGMVAVSQGVASAGGEMFNEIPDRLSDALTLVGAGYAIGGTPELGYIAAIAAVFTAYVRVQGCSLGTKADFCGPMAKVNRMIVIIVAALYTAFAPSAWQPVCPDCPSSGALTIALAIVIVGCVITSIRRLRHTFGFLKAKES